MKLKPLVDLIKGQKVPKEHALQVCFILFFFAVGLSATLSIALRLAASWFRTMIGGAA